MIKCLLLCCFCLAWTTTYTQTDGCLTVYASNIQTNPGENICIPIRVRDFNNIVGMQYTHRWDPTIMEWNGWQPGALPDLSAANFGVAPSLLSQGIVPFSWIDLSVQGVSLADSTVLYSLCFHVTGDNDQQGVFYFYNAPTAFEFSTGDSEIVNIFNFIGGSISVGSTAVQPNIVNGCNITLNCLGGSFDISPDIIDGTPPYSYAWSGPNGFYATTPSVENVVSGIYHLTVVDQAGATVKATFSAGPGTVEVSSEITVDDCQPGGTGAIDITIEGGTGSFLFAWSTGDTTEDLVNLVAGTYTLTLTDATEGCEFISIYEVGQNSVLNFETNISPISCMGPPDGSVSLVFDDQLPSPQSLIWSTGDTTTSITGLSPGAYFVTITDAFGCLTNYSMEVGVADLSPIGGNIVYPTCLTTGSIDLQVPTTGGPYTIAWNQGDTTSQLTNLSAGTYSVTITAPGGCNTQSNFELPDPNLQVAIAYDCINFPDTIITTLLCRVWGGGTPPYTFQWSNGIDTVDDEYSSTVVAYPGTYGITVTDDYGCAYENNQITPDCNQGDPINMLTAYSYTCNWTGNEWIADISIVVWSGGTPPYTFQWSTGEVTTGPLTSTISGPAENSYAVTIVDSQGNYYIPPPPTPECSTQDDADVDLYFSANPNEVAPGEVICVDVKVKDFEQMVSAQFSIEWDTAFLSWENIESGDLTEITIDNFGTNPDWLQQGKLAFSWIALNHHPEGYYSLPDDAVLFRLCLRAKQDATGVTVLNFGNTPTPFEFIQVGDQTASFEYNSINIYINNNAADHITLEIGNIIAGAGESVCVPITAQYFNDVIAMQWSITWDTSLVAFESVVPQALPALSLSSNFGYSYVQNGFLTFSWFDPLLLGLDLSPGTVLYDLCFHTKDQIGTTAVSFSNSPTHIDIASSNNGEYLSLNAINGSIEVTDLIVWPGDANHNDLVNHFDLLPVGLAYGATGPERPDATSDWTGQYAHAWNQTTPQSQVDFAHIDTNGDGIINAADTLALVQNWGSETGFTSGNPPVSGFNGAENFLTGIPLYVQADTLVAGDTAILDIILGDEDIPADNIYGLAFSIVYDPDIVVAGSVSAAFNPSWIGQIGNNLLAVAREDIDNHRIDIAVTRIDGNNTSGFGIMGQLQVTIEDVIFSRSAAVELHLSIENVRVINVSEEPIPSAPVESTIIINTITDTEDATAANDIRVFPNPVGETLNLDTKVWMIEDASLYNAAGKQVGYWNRPGAALALGHLLPGWYKLALTTEQGVVYFSIIKK